MVRVRASEVRKRLAQYYQESSTAGDVRIEVPSGSYRAEFHWPAEATAASAVVARRGGSHIGWAIALSAAVLLAAWGLSTWLKPPPSALERFWAPVLASPKPVLVYCGQPVVYFLSREVHAGYRATLPPERQRGTYAVELAPDAVVHGRDIIPVTDQFVGIGNAHTSALVAQMLAARSKPVEIRYANDLSFSDLRGGPAVLVGAFSNLWTLELMAQARFFFEQEEGTRRIRDRMEKKTWELPNRAPDGKTPEDYAVVSRILDSASGQVLIVAAGITQYGTRSAGEFLTDASRLEAALAGAPADWPRRNVQVLLHTTVYKGTPAPPKVLATHVW